MTGYGRQSDTVVNHGGENGDDDEAQDGERHNRNNEVGAGTSKENGGLAYVENLSSMPESDPLAESISKLQTAKEALEKEVQKLHEIGDESRETTDEVHEASSSCTYSLTENTEISPCYLQKHVNTLKQDVDFLESKLKEANAVLKAKEITVTKLECEEIEAEIEDLFKHKLEAEFQHLTLARAVDNLKTNMIDQVALSEEFETALNVVRDAQSNVNMLKRQAEKLETRVEDTVETEQAAKLQKRVCQVTSCLFIQLILLILVFVSFVLHLAPHDSGVVPT